MRTEQEVRDRYRDTVNQFAVDWHKESKTNTNLFVIASVLGWMIGKSIADVEDEITKAVGERGVAE